MNPELRRYLWTELTLHRVALAAVVLGAAFWIAWASDGVGGLHAASWYVAMLAGLFWATFLTAGAVKEEITERTWDGQRLSALGPGTLALGKLFGAPAFPNLIMAVALGLHVATHPPGFSTGEIALKLALTAGGALLGQAAALLAGAQAVAMRGESGGRARNAFSVLFGLAVALPFVAASDFVWPFDDMLVDMRLWGTAVLALPLLAGLVWIYWGWAVLGLRDTIRRELGAVPGPLLWLAFLLFTVLLAAGIESVGEPDADAGRLARTLAVIGLACYASAFTTTRDAVSLRRWLGALRRAQWRQGWREAPGWAFPALLVAPVAAVFAAHHWAMDAELAALALNAGFAILRDVGVIVLLGVLLRKRGDIAALVYLLLLHALLPGAIEAAGGSRALVAVVSPWPGAPAWTALFPAIEAAAVFALVALRVRARG